MKASIPKESGNNGLLFASVAFSHLCSKKPIDDVWAHFYTQHMELSKLVGGHLPGLISPVPSNVVGIWPNEPASSQCLLLSVTGHN
jgi:hypothetical protein